MDHQSLEAQLADLQARLAALEKQKRRRWGALIAVVVLSTGAALAGPVTMTQFSPNTAAVAAQVNANFNGLNGRIEEVNTTLQASIAAAAAATVARTPAGTIAFFDVSVCPAGWTELTAARGRAVVGLPQFGTAAGVNAASPLSDLEDRAHLHRWAVFTSALNWHSWDSSGTSVAAVNWGDGMDSAGAGSYPFAPPSSAAVEYFTEKQSGQSPTIQLLACKRN